MNGGCPKNDRGVHLRWTPGGVARYTRRDPTRDPQMAALLPILLFVIIVGAANFFEFGRVD